MEKRRYIEPSHELAVRAEVDILVVGGGPAGIMAAQAAAKQGVKVMLIESRSFLGGNLTTGLPILGFLGRKGNQIIKGLPQRFIDRMAEHNATSGHRACPLHVSLTMIEPEYAKTLSLDLMRESGVEVLMYVFCAGVIKEDNAVKGVIIESKAGREVIYAKTVIDCTGDGDVAFKAGVECQKGDKSGGMQPPTLMFCMKGVDVRRLRETIADNPEEYDMDYIPNEFFRPDANFTMVGMRNIIAKARRDGMHIPVERTIIMTGIAKDEMWINMSRVNGVDSTDPESNTRGEIEARKQNDEVAEYLKRYMPGFEKAWVEKSAPFLGIRESRRIVGEYMLTDQDILDCRRFDDVVAVASYPVDIHHPEGGDCTLYWCDDCYDIPYRTLVPQKVENLLVAGRCSSMTHEAMGSTRVMSTCMALGEAAGKAAQIAVTDEVTPSKIDVKKLQKALRDEGVYFRD